MDRWIDGWIGWDGWMDRMGWMDGWMDEWVRSLDFVVLQVDRLAKFSVQFRL